MNPEPKRRYKGIEFFVSERIHEYYQWRAALESAPSLYDIRDKIDEINHDFLSILRVKGWERYNDYFMDSILFITANDRKIQKHEEAQARMKSWA